jgi:hypothetical protein
VRAALWPLFKGRVRVMDFGLAGVRADWRDSVSGITLRARVDAIDGGSLLFDPASRAVRLSRVKIDGGGVALAIGSGTAGEPPVDTLPSEPWRFEVGHFDLKDFGFALDLPEARSGSQRDSQSPLAKASKPAFDYNHIRISDAALSIHDLSFDGATGAASAQLEELQLAERSGLRVIDGSGLLTMTPDEYALKDLAVKTSGSRLSGSVMVGAGIARMDGKTPVEGRLTTSLSTKEIALFAPLPAQFDALIEGRDVTLSAAVSGTLDAVRLEYLAAELPPNLALRGHGTVRRVLTPEKMSGDVTLDGTLSELDFARSLIPDTALRRRIAFPHRMTLRAGARFTPKEIDLHSFALLADSGRIEARGRFAMGDQRYDGEVRLVDFPLGAFLPHDSLGAATASLTARGRGFDPSRLRTTAALSLERLVWKRTQLGRVTADIDAERGRYVAAIKSRNDLVTTNISLEARLERDTVGLSRRMEAYRARLRARAQAGLQSDPQGGTPEGGGAGLTETPNSPPLNFSNPFVWRRSTVDSLDTPREPSAWQEFAARRATTIRRTTDRPPRRRPLMYSLDVKVDSTVLYPGTKNAFDIDPITLTASASRGGAKAALRSGDLTFDISSPLSPELLVSGVAGAGSEVMRQITARHFSPDSLQSALPQMTLRASAGRENFVRDMARASGFDFRTLSLDISTTPDRPFHIDALAAGVTMGDGGLAVDTLDLHAVRNGAVVDYRLRMANRPSTIADLGLISVSGSVGGRSLTANVLQRNNQGLVGFDFGIGVSFADTAVVARMMPGPILGYDRWRVGRVSDKDGTTSNWIALDMQGKLTADLHIRNGGLGVPHPSIIGPVLPARFIALTSATLPGIPRGALRLSAGGLDLKAMLDLFPTAPHVGGTISSDVTFGFHPDGAGGTIIAARGNLGAKDFSYEGRRVADIVANVSFGSVDAAGKALPRGTMLLDAEVSLEGTRAVMANGTWAASEIDFTLDIPAVPLSVAQGVLPPGAATLTGNFNGRVRITGTPEKPLFTGDVGFTDGRADIALIGTAFGISPDRITIADHRVSFNDFGLVAPNNRRLAMNGAISIADLTSPRADLTIRSRGFRFVDSRHVGGSQIYGTASLDANITARGPVDAMTVRGDVALASNSDIVYIMRSEVQKVRDEKQHIVQFVTFADSLYTDDEDTPPIASRQSGVDVLLGIRIEDGLKATLSLDEYNENRVQLIGGGDLTYSMNRQGDTRLAGRYTLGGGTLYYKPPVIPQKIFAVTDGSYVEWAGAVADPRISIKASQNSNIRVDSEDGSSREVDFKVSVDVAGSLSGVDMKFDLAAPADMVIHNELLGMRPEERAQQALTLLVYNQYMGPGSMPSGRGKIGFDARGQLNAFISKEISQWARNNLQGVDFTMGIDTHTDATASDGSRTDYSYSVSKSIFSDRVKITIGGKVSDETSQEKIANSLLEDVSLEYRLTRRDNMFLKLYRHNKRVSILEGEVTETGGGFLIRKKVNRLGDLFRIIRPRRWERPRRISPDADSLTAPSAAPADSTRVAPGPPAGDDPQVSSQPEATPEKPTGDEK